MAQLKVLKKSAKSISMSGILMADIQTCTNRSSTVSRQQPRYELLYLATKLHGIKPREL
jgi:hypothetical protein